MATLWPYANTHTLLLCLSVEHWAHWKPSKRSSTLTPSPPYPQPSLPCSQQQVNDRRRRVTQTELCLEGAHNLWPSSWRRLDPKQNNKKSSDKETKELHCNLSGFDDFGDVEIGGDGRKTFSDQVRLVRLESMHLVPVLLRVDGHTADAHLGARAKHADCYLAWERIHNIADACTRAPKNKRVNKWVYTVPTASSSRSHW